MPENQLRSDCTWPSRFTLSAVASSMQANPIRLPFRSHCKAATGRSGACSRARIIRLSRNTEGCAEAAKKASQASHLTAFTASTPQCQLTSVPSDSVDDSRPLGFPLVFFIRCFPSPPSRAQNKEQQEHIEEHIHPRSVLLGILPSDGVFTSRDLQSP